MRNKSILKFLITGTIVSIMIMAFTGHPIKQSTSNYKSILCLEFADDSSKVQSIIDSWQSETIQGKTILQHARINTCWDFMFIFFYSTSLFFAHRSFLKAKRRAWQMIFSVIGSASLIAGVLDIIENIEMLQSIKLLITDQNAYMTAACARIKFILLAGSIGVLFIRWLYSKFTVKPE